MLAAKIAESLDRIRRMTGQEVTQHAAQILTETLVDIITFRAAGLAAGRVADITKYLSKISRRIAAERSVAAAVGTTPTMTSLLEDAAPIIKHALEEAGPGATQTSKLAQAAECGAVAGEEKVAGVAGTGTVWDSIKMTDPMLPGTRIPKSFVLTTKGNQQFWVAPNATKHMAEYVIDAQKITHGMPINNQSLLSSFKAAVDQAVEQGIVYTKEYRIDCWEIVFSESRGEGLLPAIKHALYKPQGF
jgi:hypothetical protein